MELFVLFILLLFNGLFAMSEIALVSSKKVRLETLVSKGSKGAKTSLKLLEKPEKFLSTVQVGITLISIITGAYGGLTLSEDIKPFFEKIDILKPYAGEISFMVVVSFITFFSIIIGELVPKSIAFNNPEGIAIKVAPFMLILSIITSPIVYLLELSTKGLLKIFMFEKNVEPPVTEEEFKILLEQGTRHGVLEARESEMIKSIFRFGDRKAYSVMTNRHELIWIDINDDFEKIKSIIVTDKYSVYPVCEDNIDNILGIVSSIDFLSELMKQPKVDIRSLIIQPLYIPENVSALKILEQFRTKKTYTALVINEYGLTEGMITLHNLIESIFGELPEQKEEEQIFRRDDGSLLADGNTQIDVLKDLLDMNFDSDNYSTLGGFMMFELNKVPTEGDKVHTNDYIFEIVDMDDMRVDKVLITKVQKAE